MALAFGPATLIGRSGQADQLWSFTIILDGTLLTQTAMAFPTGFPAFSATLGPAGGSNTISKQSASRVIYMPGCGGTSGVSSAVKIIPTAAAVDTQLDVFVSAAGTNLQTVQVLAIVKDQGY